MIDNRYDGFKLQCKNINEYNILSFKKNNYLKGIVENVSYEYGLKYLNNITKYNMNLNWDIISKINNIGDPLNYEYSINNIKIILNPVINIQHCPMDIENVYMHFPLREYVLIILG